MMIIRMTVLSIKSETRSPIAIQKSEYPINLRITIPPHAHNKKAYTILLIYAFLPAHDAKV